MKNAVVKMPKIRAPRNRTLTCTESETTIFKNTFKKLNQLAEVNDITDQIANQDFFDIIQFLPKSFVDLLVIDPPYNLSKDYHGHLFKEKDKLDYQNWFDDVISKLVPCLKPNATIYICSDWKTSTLIAPILEKHFIIRNRITWERDKGRGALSNWKNNTEDIWFCTRNDDYYFNVDAVKLKRKVIAPYRDLNGKPKDWEEQQDGNFRLTHPSNIWTDITIPFWSMPENTDHPTQKPEKLIAKLILASSKENEFILDPFMGSGTTGVVSKKLNRRFFGIEQNTDYCCWARKRIESASNDKSIQGYADGVFWERNSLADQKLTKTENADNASTTNLNLFNE